MVATGRASIIQRERVRMVETEMDIRAVSAELIEKHDKAEMERHDKEYILIKRQDRELLAGDIIAARITRQEIEDLIADDINCDYWENSRHEYYYVDSPRRAAKLEGKE